MGPVPIKTSFAVQREINPLYSGGPVAISDDLLATTLINHIQISRISTGERITKLEGDSEIVTAVCIAPNESVVVVCSRSLLMRIYSLPDGKLMRQIKAHEAPVITLDIDTTSTLLATGAAEGLVKVWDIKGGFVTHQFKGHGGVISALKLFGRAGGQKWQLASGADDCTVRVWDLVKSSCIAVFKGHSSVIRGLDFSSDGQTLLSGSRDQTVNTWNLKTSKLKQSLPVYEVIESVGYLDDDRIYVGGEKDQIRVFDLNTKQVILEEAMATKTTETVIQQLHYSSSQACLMAVHSNQTIHCHAVLDSLPLTKRIVGQFDEIIDCTYVMGDSILAIASNSEDIHLMHVDDNNIDVLSGHTDIVLTIDRDYSGKYLISGGKDNCAKLWNLNTAVCEMTFTGHTESIGAVALSRVPAEAKPEFALTGAQDRTIKCWDPNSDGKRSRWTIKAHDKDINAIDVAPNDKYFASASQDRLCKIWEVETGEVVGVLRGHKRGVWTVNFSLYEKVIATGSGDRTVKLWSLNDFTCLKTFEGHTNSVLKCLFLSAGQQIASAGGDGLVKIWTIKTNECQTTLDNHEDRVWSLALKQDDATLISGGADSVVTIWRDTTAEEAEAALEAQEAAVQNDQTLSNHIHNKDWHKAIALALSLDRPAKLLNLFTQVIDRRAAGDESSITGLLEVDHVLASLTSAQLARLLLRVRDWNTTARTSPIAQQILFCLLRAYEPSQLISIPGIQNIIDPLLSYSERHYSRMNGILQDSYILDFTISEMTQGISNL